MVQRDTFPAELELRSVKDCTEDTTNDHRRPGRPSPVSPTLVPPQRGEPPSSLPLSDETELVEDQEAFAPRIVTAVALAISVPLWAAIGFGVWALFR